MSRDWSPPHLRRPGPAWALVGLLHLAVAWCWWTLSVWPDRTQAATERAPLVVTLLLQAQRITQAPLILKDPPKGPPRPSQPLRVPEAWVPDPQAITLPAPSPSPEAPAATPGPETPASPPPRAGNGPPALNLSLPRGASAPWRQRNPALDDPRSNTAKLTLEQKLANAMGGDGSWQMERVDNDHIRYRRGDECLLVTRSRAGQLELGNGAFRNAWMVGNC